MKSYFDIVGDGGSDVVGQVAEQRRRLDAALGQVRFTVAIGSGKGGVGKSTLTRQLGSALVAEGRRVAILDADINGPTQARLAGMREVPLIPGKSGLALPRTPEGLGVVSLGSVIPESESVEFASVARGDSHTWRATREFALVAEVMAAVEWGPLDFLLVDLPPGAERTFQYAEFLGKETAFVLVTIPSDLARGVVLRSVAALGKTRNRLLGYIENMKGYHCADCGSVKPLFPESERVELPIPRLGSVPFDPQLAADCDAGVVGVGSGSAVVREALREIGSRLRQALEESPVKFLCVPCDEPMKLLQSTGPDNGSVSLVYGCEACGYEMAMLTNAHETQVVSSLGVQIGAGPSTGSGQAASGESKCPFTGMVQGMTGASVADATVGEAGSEFGWTAEAEQRLETIPAFIRPMAKSGIEKFARDKGYSEVDERVLQEARSHFGM